MKATYAASESYYVIRDSHPPVITTENVCSWQSDRASSGTVIFRDLFTRIEFKSSLENLYLARYYLNRNFALGQYQTLADFYEFMGVYMTKPEFDRFGKLGWGDNFFSSGFVWIDVDLVEHDLKNNIYYIQYGYKPENLEELL